MNEALVGAGAPAAGRSRPLAQAQAARYLLDRGLLGPEAVLDGDLAIGDASSRNRIFRVQRNGGECYLLKQGMSEEAGAMVAHEAAVYASLTREGSAMRAHVPCFHGYDAERGVLILQLLDDAQDLRTLHLAAGPPPPGLAALLGSALGTLHRTLALPASAAPAMPRMPWALWVHRPDASVFREASMAALELIRIVQGAEGFPQALQRLREGWRQTTVIHGDVKWDNCLVRRDEEGAPQLRLIDWESAAPGDPAWDIGSALAHHLSFWLFSIPVTGAEPPERFPELASRPLDAMKPALAACWMAYVDARGLSEADAQAELLHAVTAAGARLLQTAFEAAQMMAALTSAIVLHLQLALNILQRPHEAAIDLLGLPLPAESRG